MRRSNVVHNARVAAEPLKLRPEDTAWEDAHVLTRGRIDRPIYTRKEMDAARREASDRGREEGQREGSAEGHTRGVAEGLARGHAEEQDRLRGQRQALEHLSAAILEERGRLVTGASHDLVTLAIGMAERIARRQISVDSTVVRDVVAEALQRVADARQIVVRVNPAEKTAVSEHLDELRRTLSADARLEVRADAAVTMGSSTVDTPELHVDATVEGFLERLEEALGEWAEQEVQLAQSAAESRISAGDREERSDAA